MANSNVNMDLSRYLDSLVAGIDVSENTEWENETRVVSTNVCNALSAQMRELRDMCDTRFLDYCSCVKSLLAVYNFGNLATVDELTAANERQSEIDKCRKKTENDKKLMLSGVRKIIEHLENIGADITPYLSADDCMQIFGNSDNTHINSPVTLSAATAMTTLVYFRRLCNRKGLYADSELGDTHERIAKTVAQIMYQFATYALANGYSGWGFTLDPAQSTAVTLNDTYAVVDAISRFDDAFNQDDKIKRDEPFMNRVIEYGKELGFEGDVVDCCITGTFRTAYNTYSRDKDKVYGKSVFYTDVNRVDRNTVYSFNPISIDQIASSNRSSALFNPLYIAMITMYGYNEKELVIRRFMDDDKLAKQYFEKYELNNKKDDEQAKNEQPEDQTEEQDEEKSEEKSEKKMLISEYAETLDWFSEYAKSLDEFKDNNVKEVFTKLAEMLTRPHDPMSNNYKDSDLWKRYYNIARVFQKYLETQLDGELMKIAEYRDYLNATKDAIDQVQVAYRKFDDSQRLGIVDTDYVMFSSLDIKSDPVNISKLNKANISVNYLRPMLLSAKIMIVKALTKYPQADMETLYNAIKESKYRKKVSKTRSGSDDYLWLWNEDSIDMNSTSRHCEAIMYDYFDYFERYELSYKALNNLKKYYSKLIDKDSVKPDGSLDMDKLLAAKGMNDFKRVVLNLTRKNVDEVQLVYTQKLRDKDNDIIKLKAAQEQDRAEHENALNDLKEEYERLLEEERAKHRAELSERQTSYDIGNTVRGWIREEADRHLQDMLTYMILNNINGYQEADDDFRVGKMMYGRNFDELADGKFDLAHVLAQKIMAAYKQDKTAAEEQFGSGFKSARKMQALFEGALDDTLKSSKVENIMMDNNKSLGDKNDDIRTTFARAMYKKRLNADENNDGE